MRQRRAAQNPTTRLIKRGSGRRRVARSYQRRMYTPAVYIQLFAHARSVAATTDSADEKRCSANHLTKVTSSGR